MRHEARTVEEYLAGLPGGASPGHRRRAGNHPGVRARPSKRTREVSAPRHQLVAPWAPAYAFRSVAP